MPTKFQIEQEQTKAAYKTWFEEQVARVHEEANRLRPEQCTFWGKRTAREWARAGGMNPEDHDDTGKYPGWDQLMFVRDEILCGVLGSDYGGMYPPDAKYEESVGAHLPDLLCIGTHTSKSITLPVMQIAWNDLLATFRYNYHDWKVSIRTPDPIPREIFRGLFDTENDDDYVRPVYFEGFPDAYIYPQIHANDYPITAQFSASLCTKYQVYVLMWLIKRWWKDTYGD